jgi:hypothetical protein
MGGAKGFEAVRLGVGTQERGVIVQRNAEAAGIVQLGDEEDVGEARA